MASLDTENVERVRISDSLRDTALELVRQLATGQALALPTSVEDLSQLSAADRLAAVKAEEKQQRKNLKALKVLTLQDKEATKPKSGKSSSKSKPRTAGLAGSKVRLHLVTVVNENERVMAVHTRAGNLTEIFKVAKNKFTSKKNKLKKPSRAFVQHGGGAFELTETLALMDDDVVTVTCGETPAWFQVAAESNGGSSTATAGAGAGSAPPADPSADGDIVVEAGAAASRQSDGRGGIGYIPSGKADAVRTHLEDNMARQQASAEYGAMQQARQRLPASQMGPRIVEEVEGGPATIISGETGSGKTTQVPQVRLPPPHPPPVYLSRSAPPSPTSLSSF
jgi:HrpA-like RNA helicase